MFWESQAPAAAPADALPYRLSVISPDMGVAILPGDPLAPFCNPASAASRSLLRLANKNQKKAASKSSPPTTPTTMPAMAPPLRPEPLSSTPDVSSVAVGAGWVTVRIVPPTVIVVTDGGLGVPV